jgi:hypothetical protein
MSERTERQLRLEDWGGRLAVEPKQSPAGKTPSAPEIDAPVRGRWKDHPSYQVWRNMKCRCFTPSNTDFHRYGGRGITVCDRWMDFEMFALDIGPRPSMAHTIDRINGDGNYEPGNCVWATRKQQSDHTSRNRRLEFQGRVMTVTQWARELRLPSYVLFGRIYLGWTVEAVLTTPLQT